MPNIVLVEMTCLGQIPKLVPKPPEQAIAHVGQRICSFNFYATVGRGLERIPHAVDNRKWGLSKSISRCDQIRVAIEKRQDNLVAARVIDATSKVKRRFFASQRAGQDGWWVH